MLLVAMIATTFRLSRLKSKIFLKFHGTPNNFEIHGITSAGESERFSKWEKAENRMLLWHGSRLANWVGILSQGNFHYSVFLISLGLRIAPPEAPKTGYRFGKVYENGVMF